MMPWIMVFLGGGLGSLLRYGFTKTFGNSLFSLSFPLGTFISNLLACYILGILIQKQLSSQLSDNYRLFLAIGFCGGFSTFSTLAYELYQYIQKDQIMIGLFYTISSVIFGIVILIAGMKTSL